MIRPFKRFYSLVLIVTGLVAVAAAEARWKTIPFPPPMPVASKSGFAPVNGIKMYYAIYGSGEPLLLIHSGLASSDIWSYQIDELAKKYKVIVADTRGHGKTTRAGSYGYDLFAADYIALLDYLKIPKVAVVGSSDGGIIGLDMAMSHPERIAKLFAHAANATVEGLKQDVAQEQTVAGNIERVSSGPTGLWDESSSYDKFVLAINRMWDREPNWTHEQLAAIHVPTAIVLGDHDEAIRLDHTEYMAGAIPGAKLVILKGVGHAAMLQDPEAYTQAILTFLEE